jgi:hypothetical protein
VRVGIEAAGSMQSCRSSTTGSSLTVPIENPAFSKVGSSLAKEPAWALQREGEVLPFTLGGCYLARLHLRAATLVTPFTQLTADIEANVPPWKTFPDEIEAAVVPAQPIDVTPPRFKLLPHSIRLTSSHLPRYFINVRGSFADYLRQLGSKSRRNLSYELRKFTDFSGGKINWREFCSPQEITEFYSLATQISRKAWKEQIGGPGFSGTVSRDKITDIAIKGLARGFILFHKDRPVAYAYCRIQYEHLVYEHIGYDPGYAKWSPGKVLLYLLLERLFNESRHQCLDLGEGVLAYKVLFATDHVQCVRVWYFRRTFRNFFIAAANCLLTTTSVSAGSLLEKVRLKQTVKRLLRG